MEVTKTTTKNPSVKNLWKDTGEADGHISRLVGHILVVVRKYFLGLITI
jgi:hypothetical protein